MISSLPDLLTRAVATRAESTGRQLELVNGHLAQLFELVSELMVKYGRGWSAWTAADRAVQAADNSGDPLLQAGSRRMWAIVLRREGHLDVAERLIVDTATTVQRDLHRSAEHLTVFGALLSTAGYTAAVEGDRSKAHTLLDEAQAAARRLGTEHEYRALPFGPTAVALYQISTARVLGDFGQAIELARRVAPHAIPNAERRARYWSDVARSFHQWDKPEHAYRALLAAEIASPDEVRHRAPIQGIVADLLDRRTRLSLPGLNAFATRVGVDT
ncbi:hypothetical protein [Saccharothrix sp. Mg75]|uniref:hypothetical protein n=1 Tax=Saccharothrix sp. Mg75 TaxID=3445357 RepID=UPI003EE84FF2